MGPRFRQVTDIVFLFEDIYTHPKQEITLDVTLDHQELGQVTEAVVEAALATGA